MLNITHTRAGEALAYRWGFWHLWAFERAVNADGGAFWKRSTHTFERRYVVVDESDGEELHIFPGDVVDAYTTRF